MDSTPEQGTCLYHVDCAVQNINQYLDDKGIKCQYTLIKSGGFAILLSCTWNTIRVLAVQGYNITTIYMLIKSVPIEQLEEELVAAFSDKRLNVFNSALR